MVGCCKGGCQPQNPGRGGVGRGAHGQQGVLLRREGSAPPLGGDEADHAGVRPGQAVAWHPQSGRPAAP